MEPGDVHKTAHTTPVWPIRICGMPFGLRNAAQTYQRFIDKVLRGLPIVYAYIDDMLVASDDMYATARAALALAFRAITIPCYKF